MDQERLEVRGLTYRRVRGGTTAEQFQDKRVCVQMTPQLTSQPKSALTQDTQHPGCLHPGVPGPGTVCLAETPGSSFVLSAPALSTIQTPPWQEPNCPRLPFSRVRAAPDGRDAALSQLLALVFPVSAPLVLSSSRPALPAPQLGSGSPLCPRLSSRGVSWGPYPPSCLQSSLSNTHLLLFPLLKTF